MKLRIVTCPCKRLRSSRGFQAQLKECLPQTPFGLQEFVHPQLRRGGLERDTDLRIPEFLLLRLDVDHRLLDRSALLQLLVELLLDLLLLLYKRRDRPLGCLEREVQIREDGVKGLVDW